jgi:prepilin-type N-terminal cleavage/methylation domain-containing protein
MRLEQGFTLVELMVAMVVGSIAIASAYASYEVIAKQYEKVKGVTEMQSSSRSIMRMIERDIRMAGFKWRNSEGTITFGSISEPIKITDSGNKCCDAVTVIYDYRDEASKKVERHKIHYTVKPYQDRNRLYRKRDILFPEVRAGNNDVLADYVEDLQLDDVLADYVEDLQLDKASDVNLYIGGENRTSLIVLNPDTMVKISEHTVPIRFGDMAFHNGKLYIGGENRTSLIVLNPDTMVKISEHTVPIRFGSMAFHNGKLYIGGKNRTSLIVLNPDTMVKISEHTVPIRFGSMAFSVNSSGNTPVQTMVSIDLILRTKKEFGSAHPYKKKDYHEGNYDINKNDAYKRQEYSSTVMIRNPL